MANRIRFKARQYFGFFHPLMTWENHCFGWKKGGHSSQEEYTGTDVEITDVTDTGFSYTATDKTKVIRWAYFKRHEEYPTNVLFGLLEILMNIVSFIRVYIGKWLIIGAIAIRMFFINESSIPKIVDYLFAGAEIIYGASIAIALAGFIVRKAFGLDQKIDNICEENGWKKWSEYQDE